MCFATRDEPIFKWRQTEPQLILYAVRGFNRLYGSGRIQEAACWAHLRRKFFDLHQAHASPIATEAIERIGQLYAIEIEIRGRPPDERQRVRDSRSRPLLTSLHAWFEE